MSGPAINLDDLTTSLLFGKLQTGYHPDQLSEDEINWIAVWIKRDAPEE
ncbi:MAG: hypothetical protein IMY76_04060 [Chloroflexi bacterium]|nr:hypothetical protein [Chloroflexota bacterium]